VPVCQMTNIATYGRFREIFIPHLYLGDAPSDFAKRFGSHKTRMIWLPCVGDDNMLSSFHRIPDRNGQTDGRTDRIAISISRVSWTHHVSLRSNGHSYRDLGFLRQNMLLSATFLHCLD